jgi:predicted DNA-binding protein with PD1-like motif
MSIFKFTTMKSMIKYSIIFWAFFSFSFTILNAQEIKTILPGGHIHAPNDVVSNDEVPDVYSFSTQFKEIIIVRLKYKTDLLDGLKKTVTQNNIKNAVILSGIGSACKYHVHSVANTTFPSTNNFYHENYPMDIASVSGYILNGRVHAHVSLSDGKKSIGGHLEQGTEIFTFCVITIGILQDDVTLERLDDKTWR